MRLIMHFLILYLYLICSLASSGSSGGCAALYGSLSQSIAELPIQGLLVCDDQRLSLASSRISGTYGQAVIAVDIERDIDLYTSPQSWDFNLT